MQKIKINNVDLYYEEHGQGDNVMILLHGFLSSSKMWGYDYLPEFTKKYKVYTLDVRGHGCSHRVQKGCHVMQMTDDLHQFVLKKKLNNVIVAGISMGGAIALQFAINFPEIVKALVLISPGPGTLLPKGTSPQISKGLSNLLPAIAFVPQKTILLKLILESTLKYILPSQVISDISADAALVSKDTWAQYANTRNRIVNIKKLKTMTTPTLVLIAEYDTVVPVRFQERVADSMPNGVKVIIKNETHAMTVNNPMRVIAEINKFFANTCL